MTEQKLKPFDYSAKCLKCGSYKVSTKYCNLGGWEICKEIKTEHLHRRCENCDYVWLEECLDS